MLGCPRVRLHQLTEHASPRLHIEPKTTGVDFRSPVPDISRDQIENSCSVIFTADNPFPTTNIGSKGFLSNSTPAEDRRYTYDVSPDLSVGIHENRIQHHQPHHFQLRESIDL
ncbi:Uncharacterized protein Rs2_27362 [Raphanus sativus]|nr:Uncharacterized protein Rs2_27362 [Raphanus sativus]